MENSVATQTVTASSKIEVVNQLKNQLEEKTKTCESLNKKVKDLQEANQLAAERHLLVSENLCKMVEKVEEAIISMEDKMAATLERIEKRLDRLEAVSTNPAPILCELSSTNASPDNTRSAGENMAIDESAVDLTTIDFETLSRLHDVISPISPVINPISPVISPIRSPAPVLHSSGSVTDELIQSCVTPRKVAKVHETLQGERERHRCAIKLLPSFFTKEELAMGNMEGNFGKDALHRTKLNSLKVLLFTKFPIGPEQEESKSWKVVKGKINAKCRANRFVHLSRETVVNSRSA
ncbi:hypothetical protein OS493_030381 [Desmophyllum pertusum]|uniref:BEN domain-containing protein n=1 Tax=Desmophyllum pertusum TaxID=174260 RepID=A0A9W9Z920_9CNID|nr:hypothetical protein OS493_030381 [Desmophyllum pertusum]